MSLDQDQQNALELHSDGAISGPSGPHGLLFLDATGLLQIGPGAIPVFRSAVAYYDKIFNVVGVQPPPLFILRPRTEASLIGKAALRAHVRLDISCHPLQSLDPLISDPPSAEFPDHNIVSWNIDADAQAKPFLAKVGTATNREQLFTIFKDDNHVVFDRDGFRFVVRYYARA
jgi:hypothetical protein